MTAPHSRERLKFLEFGFERLADGRCRARVVLERTPGQHYRGTAEGLGSPTGELRCAAQATTEALQEAVGEKLTFELLGVKAVRAFDATVVIVSLAAQGEGSGHRVVGSYLTEEDAARGAALAVLNATNRILGNRLFMR